MPGHAFHKKRPARLLRVGLPLFAVAAVALLATVLYPSGGAADSKETFVVVTDGSEKAVFSLPLPPRSTEPDPAAELPPVPPGAKMIAPPRPSPLATVASIEQAPADTGLPAAPAQPAGMPATMPTPPGVWRSIRVLSGDTLSSIFKRQNLSQATLHRLLQADGLGKDLVRLRPGDEIRVRVHEDELRELTHAADALATLTVTLGETGWSAKTVATPTETRPQFVGGVIEQSLYVSALEAGLDDRLIMELVGIFGWDVDFALDIRAGDRFGLIHEAIYDEDGTKIADGPILAASFTNRGKTFHAVRFTDAAGNANYFDPDGYSMRKAFLRSPVDFRRISSRFRGSRYHPVLGVKRPHRGVDYAARTGTPVKASGDGTVALAGRKGGYGKTVILRHGGRYQTLYAHLSGIARGIGSGKRVKQGQVIGYVGATGLATGPHLHYEFLVDGVHRNPLTVELPQAEPLPKHLLGDFRAAAEPLLAQLEIHEKTLLAQNSER